MGFNIYDAEAITCESERVRGASEVYINIPFNPAKIYFGCYKQGRDNSKKEIAKLYKKCLINHQYDLGYDNAYEGEGSKYNFSQNKCYAWGYMDGNIDADCEYYRLKDNYNSWKSANCHTRPYEPKSWSDK